MNIRMASLAISATITALASTAGAAPPVLDFQVEDDASYQRFLEAIAAAEYARYDFVNQPKPRIAGTTAALVVFATRNPLADAPQLTAFVNAFDAAISSFAPGDPDLLRSSNLMAAVGFSTPLHTVPELAGTDTNIGEDILELLGLSVPPPDNFESMQTRMVQFDLARVRSLTESTELSNALVVGFSGNDLNGQPNDNLASVLQTYLESQGLEPFPDGVDDGRFVHVDAALSQLPIDYAAYSAALAEPVESSTLWSAVNGAFGTIANESAERFSELQTTMSNEPTLIEGIAATDDPQFMDDLVAAYYAQIDQVAMPRTIIAANALLLLQSEDPSIQHLATQSRSFGSLELQTNNTIAGIELGCQYVGGAATFIGGAATLNPVDAISGLVDVVSASAGIVDTFGDVGPPSAEEQMFEQIVEMRDQLEDVRVEMNQRFDRIEEQLNVIYGAVADGFNALGMQIGDLTQDVADISRDLTIARASLERIEDALWGVAEDVLLVDLTLITNQLLDYRDDAGVDLPYSQTNPNFVSGASDFFSWATTIAKNTTFAGDQSSTLSIFNAHDRLNGQSIGRQVNDLRVFPAQLSQPTLWPARIAAPAPWTQAASAYAQFAKENPWYFAYMYEQQLAGGGSAPDLDEIIFEGEDLAGAAANGRSETLFDALFDGYEMAMGDVATRMATVRDSALALAGYPPIDPWGGVSQESDHLAGTFSSLNGQSGLLNLPVSAASCWDIYGDTTTPELLKIIAEGQGNPTINHFMYVTDNGFGVNNDMQMRFRFHANGAGVQEYERRLVLTLTRDGIPVPINNDSTAQELVDEDLTFWINLVQVLQNGDNLTGQTHVMPNIMGDLISVHIVSDVALPGASETTITTVLTSLQDTVWMALANDPDLDDFWVPTALGYPAIIEAYLTFAMPTAMEESPILRAAMNGHPHQGELALHVVDSFDTLMNSMLGDGDNGEYLDVVTIAAERAAIAQEEVNEWLAIPQAGHSYVDWTLAELRALRDNAFRLAIDDMYQVAPDSVLIVAAGDGVTANDIDQPFRTINVDTDFENNAMYMAPQNGSVSLHADGSFTYTPDPGFEGVDSFNYRTTSGMGVGGGAPFVNSDPATVVVLVTPDGAVACPADFTGDGVVNGADLGSLLANWGTNNAQSDLNGDGIVDGADLGSMLAGWGMCP